MNPIEKLKLRKESKKKQEQLRLNVKVIQVSAANDVPESSSISYADWMDMWKKQKGLCAVCGVDLINPSNACVDSRNGVLAGLLCRKCNLGVGNLNKTELLEKAIKYMGGDK